jgi:hypothetical protein
MELPIKFWDKDIIEGKANLVGDEFRAEFMGRQPWFKVQERHANGTIMATIILHKR